MLEELNIYITGVSYFLFFVVSFFAGFLLRWYFAGKELKSSEAKAKSIMDRAEKDAENRSKEIELQGKDLMIKLRQDFENETRERREEHLTTEKRLLQKEENLEKRVDLLEQKEKDINRRLMDLHKNEEITANKSEELNKVIAEETHCHFR